MLFSPINFVGVDPTAGRHPFTFAALDGECRLVALAAGEVEDVLAFLSSQQNVIVAVNAPPRPNHGLVRSKLEKLGVAPGHLRGTDMRVGEYELREHGIVVSPTPSRSEACSSWMQMGFDFYRRLAEVGFKPFPTEGASHLWLETHPHAAFCTLLGRLPLPKPTLEGRLQRQVALHDQGMGIKDPMDFFEEITRHKLLHGILPVEYIYLPEELDAMMAAFVAYAMVNRPKEISSVGDIQEGQIHLPAGILMDKYS